MKQSDLDQERISVSRVWSTVYDTIPHLKTIVNNFPKIILVLMHYLWRLEDKTVGLYLHTNCYILYSHLGYILQIFSKQMKVIPVDIAFLMKKVSIVPKKHTTSNDLVTSIRQKGDRVRNEKIDTFYLSLGLKQRPLDF